MHARSCLTVSARVSAREPCEGAVAARPAPDGRGRPRARASGRLWPLVFGRRLSVSSASRLYTPALGRSRRRGPRCSDFSRLHGGRGGQWSRLTVTRQCPSDAQDAGNAARGGSAVGSRPRAPAGSRLESRNAKSRRSLSTHHGNEQCQWSTRDTQIARTRTPRDAHRRACAREPTATRRDAQRSRVLLHESPAARSVECCLGAASASSRSLL